MAFATRSSARRGPLRSIVEGRPQTGTFRATARTRARFAVERGAAAAGGAMRMLARGVRLAAGLVALVIVVAIVLRLLGANASNSIVSDIHDAGRTLVGPFANMFSIKDGEANMVVNWGIATVVYLILGGLVAALIVWSAPRPLR